MNDMNHPIYSRFEKDQLILRDELAIDRTLLSNERTLLAYLRSGVALVIAGVTIIQFSQEGWFWMMGAFCIPIGIIVGVIGVARFRRMNRSISLIRQQSISDSPAGTMDSNLSSEVDPDHQSV
jgi:putative membrane protein